MIRLRRFVSAVGAVSLAIIVSGAAHAESCLMPQEADAFHMRILQTDLMVAGLSCQLKQDYSQFVRSQKNHFSEHATVLKSYFARSGGGTAAMDRFITGLANGASAQSLQRTQGNYCQQARWFFTEVNRIPHDVLLQRLAYTPDIVARRARGVCVQSSTRSDTQPLHVTIPNEAAIQPASGNHHRTNNPRVSHGWGRRLVR